MVRNLPSQLSDRIPPGGRMREHWRHTEEGKEVGHKVECVNERRRAVFGEEQPGGQVERQDGLHSVIRESACRLLGSVGEVPLTELVADDEEDGAGKAGLRGKRLLLGHPRRLPKWGGICGLPWQRRILHLRPASAHPRERVACRHGEGETRIGRWRPASRLQRRLRHALPRVGTLGSARQPCRFWIP